MRRGGSKRLAGILVYHDFPWLKHFTDERAQFKNGKCLAEFVRKSCPEGKTPALLLTDNPDRREEAVETGTHFILVVNLPNYRATPANAALSYLGARVGPGITRPSRLRDAAESADPQELQEFIRAHLTAADIVAWAENNEERLDSVRDLTKATWATPPAASLEDLTDRLNEITKLSDLDARGIQAVTALLTREPDAKYRLELLRAMTEDPLGRSLTWEVLGERTEQRIADSLQTVQELEELLESGDATETEMQRFIESHPWLLGLDYADIRPRQPIVRGTVDFYLVRFDGFTDVLELKSPSDRMVVTRGETGGGPASASRLSLSPSLAQALAQIHVYRGNLSRHSRTHDEAFGLPQSWEPKVIVVIGRAAALSDQEAQVMMELNRSLHRVELVPYDFIGQRARQTLENVQRYLLNPSEPSALLEDGGAP